jgi:hypothetical protein
MKIRRKYRKFKAPKEYILMNENLEVWTGLKGGYPIFSHNIEEAKPLTDESQSRTLRLFYPYKLEIIYL